MMQKSEHKVFMISDSKKVNKSYDDVAHYWKTQYALSFDDLFYDL